MAFDFDKAVSDQVERIEDCVPYFPKNKWLKTELGLLFHSMIGPEVQHRCGRDWTQEQRLTWLCDAIVRELPGWPKGGLADVRGIYCDTFTPADGKNIFTTMENCPKPRRLIVDDGQPRIGASPVDAEFEMKLNAIAERKRVQ